MSQSSKRETEESRLEKHLGYGWLVCFIGNAALISVLPPTRPRLLMPAAFLLLYAWWAYRRIRSDAPVHLGPELIRDVADSTYFTGFLLTLWALFDTFALRNVRGTEGVFQVFSAAIVTTGAGMVARLFLSHFRLGVRGISILDASKEVAERLLELGVRVNQFSEALAQSEQRAKESVSSIQSSLNGLASEMEWAAQSFAELGKEIGAAKYRAESFWADCQQGVSQAVSSTEATLRALIETSRTNFEGVRTELGNLLRSLNEQIGRLEQSSLAVKHDVAQLAKMSPAAAQAVERVQRLGESVAELADRVARTSESLIPLGTQAEGCRKALEAVQQEGTELQRVSDSLAESLGGVTTFIEQATEAWTQSVEQLQRELRSAAEGVRKTAEEWSEAGRGAFKALAEDIGRISQGLSTHLQNVNTLAERVAGIARAIDDGDRHMRNAAGSAERLAAASNTATHALTSLTQALSKTTDAASNGRLAESHGQPGDDLREAINELRAVVNELRVSVRELSAKLAAQMPRPENFRERSAHNSARHANERPEPPSGPAGWGGTNRGRGSEPDVPAKGQAQPHPSAAPTDYDKSPDRPSDQVGAKLPSEQPTSPGPQPKRSLSDIFGFGRRRLRR